MRYLITAALALLTMAAQAQTVGVHTYTHHFDSHSGLNERNFGLYVRTQDWEAGAYRNSYRRNTLYAGKVWSYGPVSLTLGAAYGYQRKWRDCTQQEVAQTGFTDACSKPDTRVKTALMPFVAPSVAIPVGEYAVRLTAVPNLGEKPALVHLSFERTF